MRRGGLKKKPKEQQMFNYRSGQCGASVGALGTGNQKEHNSGVKIIKRSAREGKDREGNRRKKKKKIGSINKEKES